MALAGGTSDKSRGMEITLARLLFQLGSVLGSLAAPLVGSNLILFYSLSFIGIMLASGFLIVIAPRLVLDLTKIATQGEVKVDRFLSLIRKYPKQLFGVVLEVLVELPSRQLLAVFLVTQGYAVTVVGSLYAFRCISSLVCAPVLPNLISRSRGEEFLFASISGFLGWVLLLVAKPDDYFLATFGTLFLGGQSFLFTTGLESRFYAQRSLSFIQFREIILTTVRLLFVPLLCFLLYFESLFFLAFGLVFTLLIAPFGRWLALDKVQGLT
jgi:hypothetical protein